MVGKKKRERGKDNSEERRKNAEMIGKKEGIGNEEGKIGGSQEGKKKEEEKEEDMNGRKKESNKHWGGKDRMKERGGRKKSNGTPFTSLAQSPSLPV